MSTISASLKANRANAQLSTGPRTPEGKARSAQNAIRHGLTAKTVLLPTEDLRPYEKFCRKLTGDLNPQGALEEQLARNMAGVQWRLRRCRSLEQSLRHSEPAPAKQIDALNKLALYEQRLTRTFQTTLKQFRELQAERHEREASAIADAANRMKHCRSKQIAYDPAEDGFVFSAEQVDTFMQRRDRLEEAALAARTDVPRQTMHAHS